MDLMSFENDIFNGRNVDPVRMGSYFVMPEMGDTYSYYLFANSTG